jgi:lysozyme family protein
MTFDQAFQILVGHEGGFVNHPLDPGGMTKYGISNRAYPGEDIQGMTLERAKLIYQRDYWGPAGCDAVPDGVKFSLFDMAVNSGVKPAIRCLQRAVGVDDDGVLGPITLQAVASIHPSKFIARFNGHRLQFMSGLSNWPAFGRGWANRIAKNLMEA